MGLFLNTPQAFDGYTLFAPIKSNVTYLIDNCGEKVHSWTSTHQPNLSCYLLDDGTLLRAGKVPGPGGGGGVVETIDWNGTVTWTYTVPQALGLQHHDIERLPNGNILLIVQDVRTQAEVIQAGSTTPLPVIQSEQIVEVKPDLVNGGGTVVWVWKAWDHLVQDNDSLKAHYGVIGDHPERIDVNFLGHAMTDWLHVNGIDYHAGFDQIIVSVHNFSEFWIIDHSTTTAQAAGSSGGTYGHGGDLLYRWGNPQAYKQGTAMDQKLFQQHDAHWIDDNLPDGGKIILFNNQAGTPAGQNFSTVNIVAPPVDSAGNYSYGGGAYAPQAFDWTYTAAVPTSFFSNIISGVQRLPNGNTLVCEGVPGRFFEVDAAGATVWTYVNPVNGTGPQVQGTPVTDNSVFRCTRFAPTHPAFTGKSLVPQGYIETGSQFTCTVYPVDVSEVNGRETGFSVFPNPATDRLTIEPPANSTGPWLLRLCDLSGRKLMEQPVPGGGSASIGVSHLAVGTYLVRLSGASGSFAKMLAISR